MKILSKILFVSIIFLLAGCAKNIQPSKNNLSIQGSGNLASKQFNFSGFDKVEAGLAFGLTIHHGEDFKVSLTADDNFIDYILVEQVGSTLRLDYKPGYAYNVSGVTMHLEVTMPDLTGLSLGESSYTRLVNVKSKNSFEAELTSSSALEGELQAAAASFHLSGSTYINLSGSADNLSLDACGNSIANLEKFLVQDAFLKVSCNSVTSVTVEDRLDVDASQFAQVSYFGEPASVNESIYESGFVEKK